MKFDIVIPSKNRIEKLTFCLNSLFRSIGDFDNIYLALYLGTEEEVKHFSSLFQWVDDKISISYLAEYRVPTFWNSYLKNSLRGDAMLYCNDDVEFFDDTIREAFTAYESIFPDTDGVLGLNQCNITDINKVEAAFGIIGAKYADRFPNRQVYCPDFLRFHGDWEMWQYARYINRFYFASEARINHHHPCTGVPKDETHIAVRQYLQQDRSTFHKRQSLGLLWGRDWTLINS